jgi:uncharacterized membrane protein
MASRASIGGHPIHPMLVPIPIGLFVFAFVADLVVYFGGAGAWQSVAFYCMGGGIVGALLAAVFGLVDLLGLKEERPRSIGIAHMVVNLTVVGLFVVNFWMRWQGNEPVEGTPFMLTVIGIVLLLVSGWLGGHMVFVHGVGVSRTGPLVERRRNQVPVRHERRRAYAGTPLGQH